MRIKKTLLFWPGLFIILAGCAVPMVPKEVMSTVTQPVTTFREVQRDTEHYTGTTVIWGGQILGVRNDKDTSTIQVLQEPVDYDGKPANRDASQGRFLAESKEYLDAEVYAPGRRITIVGKIKGKVGQPLAEGQREYDFPVVAVEHIYLWQKEVPVYPAPYYYYYGPAVWWGPYWGMEWDWRVGWRDDRFRREHHR